MMTKNPVASLIYGFLFILIFSSCAQHRPAGNSVLDKQAFVLASQTKSFNQHITTSKGTGWARVETKSKTDTFKIAWAAAFPNKIRITFIVSGNPVETIIATGEKIIFFSHTGKHAMHTYNSKDPDMGEYIKVPIKMSEMILVLLGRLPIKPFDNARFSGQAPPLSSILLEKKRMGVIQVLQLNEKGNLQGLESTDGSGNIVYEMAITQYKTYDFGQIPVTLEIKNMDNQKLTLDIIRFQANPVIKEDVFRLTESG